MAATCVRMVGGGAAVRMLETRDSIECTRSEVWSSRKICRGGKGEGLLAGSDGCKVRGQVGGALRRRRLS